VAERPDQVHLVGHGQPLHLQPVHQCDERERGDLGIDTVPQVAAVRQLAERVVRRVTRAPVVPDEVLVRGVVGRDGLRRES
jgi:hypothetical protein